MFKIDELLKATGGKLIQGRRDLSVKGISIDSRTINPQEAFIAIRGDNFDGHNFIAQAVKKKAGCIIKETVCTMYNVQCTMPIIEVKDSIKALGDIARFQRQKYNVPVIAVTGSSGKTTAKEMIAWALSAKFKVLKNEGTKNNHIGLPLTLLNLKSEYGIVVLEIGTNHFGEVEYLTKVCQPNIGIITNIGPSHLEYLRDLNGVLDEKYTLISSLREPYLAVLNADDDLLKKKTSASRRRPFAITFGIKRKSDFYVSNIKNKAGGFEFLVNRKNKFTLNTLGHYNIYNALAAIALGRIFGIGHKDISLRLADFSFPKGRLNALNLNNIKFIDDTYNSNPLSLGEALDVLHNFKTNGRKILVMGDMLELGRHSRAFHHQAGCRVASVCDVFIGVGRLSKVTAQAAKLSGFDLKNIFTCSSSNDARDILLNKVSPGKEDIVLVKGSRAMKMENVLIP